MRLAANEIDPASGFKKLRVACDKIVDKAVEGDVQAFNAMADRIDGKPIQGLHHSGDDMAITRIERVIVNPSNPATTDDCR